MKPNQNLHFMSLALTVVFVFLGHFNLLQAQIKGVSGVMVSTIGDVPTVWEINLFDFLKKTYPNLENQYDVYYQTVEPQKQRIPGFASATESSTTKIDLSRRSASGQKLKGEIFITAGMKADRSDVISIAYNQTLYVALVDNSSPLASDLNQTKLIRIKPHLKTVVIEDQSQNLTAATREKMIKISSAQPTLRVETPRRSTNQNKN